MVASEWVVSEERIVKCSISHFSFVVVFDIAFSVDKPFRLSNFDLLLYFLFSIRMKDKRKSPPLLWRTQGRR